MLKWCSYCQQFLSEVRPFEDLGFSHGICETCYVQGIAEDTEAVRKAEKLKAIQDKLWEAGKNGDPAAAVSEIKNAEAQGLRPIDVFLGLMGPLLYKIGEQWKTGVISVADEHSFTTYCEQVFARISPGKTGAGKPIAVLANVPGNRHTFAIRVLALWLSSRGVPSVALYPVADEDGIFATLDLIRPNRLMLSVALADQAGELSSILRRIASLPPNSRPKVSVGGNAVKLGLLEQMAGAEQVSELEALRF